MTRRRRHLRALIAIALGLAAGGGGTGLAQAAPASTGASITALRCNITATGTYRLGPNVTAAAISVAIYQVNAGDLFARPLVQDGRAVSARSGYLRTAAWWPIVAASTTRYYASTVLNYRVGRGPVRRSTAVSRSISTRCP